MAYVLVIDDEETGIFLIDPETHRIVDANPLALKLVGARRELVLGAMCHKFLCPADKGRRPVTDLGQKVADVGGRMRGYLLTTQTCQTTTALPAIPPS
jgi:PAS domain-containing protein